MWYVGGNNTAIVNDISDRYLGLPMFYSGDWDFHGLDIYTRVKKILKAKSCEIELVMLNMQDAIPVNSPNHKSEWKHWKVLSGLDTDCFLEKEKQLILQLMRQDKWIEEEKCDTYALLGMV